MIFWELVKVFALTLTGLTGLFLVGLVIQQASQMGLSMVQTLTALPLLIPYTLPYTIPATTLFASCVVYGRLSHDNEVVAMKAAGVNLYSILRPAITLGILTSGMTFYLAHTVIPKTQSLLQQQLLKDPEEVLYNWLKRDRSFRSANFPYAIFVKDVQGRRLVDVVLKKKEMMRDNTGKEAWTGKYDFVVRAREARLRVVIPGVNAGPDEKPMLFVDPDRWVGGDDAIRLNVDGNRPVGVPLPDVFSNKELKDKPMNLEWPELPGKIADFRQRMADTRTRLATNQTLLATATDPTQRKLLQDEALGLQYVYEHYQRQALNTECEYHMRPSLALGCLVFALIGCPVGIWAHRADYLSSFVTCFLPTVFCYYPLLLAGSNLGRDGKVPMPTGVYLADAALGLAAIFLVFRLIKR
ncbi:MAG: LptF/LptG family permease [Gemmataceae bacterium]